MGAQRLDYAQSRKRNKARMDLAEAIKQLVPIQVLIPDPRKPLELVPHHAAEVYLADTTRGPAVIWVAGFWCDKPDAQVASIAYAAPVQQGERQRWVDNDPRFGPKCIPYQKPFIMERLTKASAAWKDYKAWQTWRGLKGKECGRRAAWARAEQEFGEIIKTRWV
jgi:hypothetical protein